MTLNLANFRTLIWDLDGTILDSYKISLEIWTELLNARGVELDPNVLRSNYHGTLRETCQAILPSVHHKHIDTILADFIARDNAIMYEVDGHLFKDAVGLIERAHNFGHRQIIVTNRAHGEGRVNASPHIMMGKSKIKHHIDHIICGDEVEHRKPKPEVLLGIDYDPATTLVIGDQHLDMQFARNIKASAVLVNRHSESFDDLLLSNNHLIVDSFDLIT